MTHLPQCNTTLDWGIVAQRGLVKAGKSLRNSLLAVSHKLTTSCLGRLLWPEYAACMHDVRTIWPFAAELGLGGAAVAPLPAVQGAMDPILEEKSAGRDYFGAQRKGALPIDLAEIGSLPGPDECLKLSFPGGTHDLDLQVATARRTSPVVGSSTGGPDTWIGSGVHRQLSWRVRNRSQDPRHKPAVLHHPELVGTESARRRHR